LPQWKKVITVDVLAMVSNADVIRTRKIMTKITTNMMRKKMTKIMMKIMEEAEM